jgi:hypothetical protein
MLQSRLGLSQRRACEIVGQHRFSQRHRPVDADPDRDLRDQLPRFAEKYPRWGYRRAHAVLRRQGWAMNRKKIQRLRREDGLGLGNLRWRGQVMTSGLCGGSLGWRVEADRHLGWIVRGLGW